MHTNHRFESSRRARWGRVTLALLFAGVAGLAGCGGGGTTAEVKLPESERPDIDAAAASSGALTIPGTAEFNYSAFSSHQTGVGRGESKRSGPAGAMCRAECQAGGSAWGEFQFGYTFDNKTGQPLDAVIKLRVKIAENNEAKSSVPVDAPGAPVATNLLTFFIRDSIGTDLKTTNLLASTVTKGPKTSVNQREEVFDVRFEPDRGYYLIVSGRSEVQAEEAESLAASVEASDIAIEITWKPAAASTTAGEPLESPALAGTPDEPAE